MDGSVAWGGQARGPRSGFLSGKGRHLPCSLAARRYLERITPAVKARILLPLLVALAALPLAAQVNDTYVIPVSGLAPGAFGTQWQTQLSVMNPQIDHQLRVSMTFIPTGGARGREAFV